LFLALAVSAPIADAQSQSPTPDQIKRASAAFKAADKKVEQRKFAEAETLLLEAWGLNPTYDLANNLGAVECQLNKLTKCAEFLTYALRTWPISDPKSRQGTEAILNQALKSVGQIRITTNVAGAQIELDGKVVGTTPMVDPLFVEPGSHTVKASLDKYLSDSKSVELKKGASSAVDLKLNDVPVAQPTGTAVATSAPTVPPIVTQPQSKLPIVLGVVGAGVFAGLGVGALIAASGEESTGKSLASTLHGACSPTPSPTAVEGCSQLEAAKSANGRDKTLSTISFAAAGGAVLSGLLYYAFSSPPAVATPKVGLQVAPVLGGDARGVVLNGTF
jgi:hypothetical protein